MKISRGSGRSMVGGQKARSTPPRVTLLIAAWNHYGRGIIEGVWQYAQQHGPWFLDMEPSEPDESAEVHRGLTSDGVIAASAAPAAPARQSTPAQKVGADATMASAP